MEFLAKMDKLELSQYANDNFGIGFPADCPKEKMVREIEAQFYAKAAKEASNGEDEGQEEGREVLQDGNVAVGRDAMKVALREKGVSFPQNIKQPALEALYAKHFA